MSTIAQPRDSSVNGRRIPLIATPTSSSRPSLDIPRSETGSPATNPPARRNRAALREYYNLKKVSESDEIPNSDAASELSSNDHSDVAESELDAADFNAEEYVKHALQSQSLSELLRTYNGVLTDIRALDAEKKALVYDNYSKLIAATETIRKMRMNMDPLNPMASTLDPAIASIYERAQNIKDELKSSLGEGPRQGRDATERRKARNAAKKVLETPENLRMLVAKGNTEEAKKQWETTRKLLERWLERGVGGQDVAACIEDGDAALRGEPPNEKSWVHVRERGINGGTQ
ncbi:hypothetical protein BP5796_07400 [Coleophoma crateriformis]|uniref:Vacuolar protein sorting-associated protein 51 homolog n=1 Tax=Coleophoma crateriformis TaxID=565419 RepID=A0A3D8RJ49_9HELO|nr:hypothetical protein BP5796_07400 [Coleophoma crateriformis]